MEVPQHITKLIAQYDYVIIPGFGGFVSKYESASIHPVQQVISPPSKAIAFNKNLASNDWLLINYIAKQEKISSSLASQQVRDFAEKSRSLLKNKEVVLLPGLGKIYSDPEENLQFVQDKNYNHLTESYGLPEISAKAVIRKQLIDINTGIKDEDTVPERSRKRIWYYAAAGFFLLVLALGSYMFLDDKTQNITYNLLGMDTTTKEIASPPAPPVTKALSAATDILTPQVLEIFPAETDILESAENATAANNVPAPVSKVEEPKTINNGYIPKGYFVVIGSFTKDKNVSRLFQQLQENNQTSYKIPGEGNFTRIGIFISDDLQDATKKLDSLRKVYNEHAWILRNR